MATKRNTLTAFLVLLAAAAAAGATNVGGTITADTTWTPQKSPYVMTSSVGVAPGVTLTIKAGVTVQAGYGTTFNVYGTLIAVGSSSKPIRFQSLVATPHPGDWGPLQFRPGSSPSSRLSYVTVTHGGGISGAVLVDGVPLTFDHLTVSNSYAAGIYATGSAASLTLSTSTLSDNLGYGLELVNGASVNLNSTAFTANGNYAVAAGPNDAVTGLTGLSLSGNGGGAKNGLYYRPGTITGSETWAPGIAWVVAATTVGSSGSLTIQPGVRVEFTSSASLTVNGTLTAIGTSLSPILFTSNQQTPTPGYWSGLILGPGSSASRLSYANLTYGGAGSAAMLRIDSASPVLDHVTAANSANDGVSFRGASANPSLSDFTITTNARYGLNFYEGGGATVTNSTVTNNTDYAMAAEPNTRLLGLTGMTVSGNGGGTKDFVLYRGGTITTSEIWSPGLTWVVGGWVYVGGGSSLTINAGTRVEMGYHAAIRVYGTLDADGTATNPILVTSNETTHTPGYWGAITFEGGAPPGRLAHTTVSYGGWNWFAAIYPYGSALTLDNVTVSYSAGIGVWAQGSTANSTISDSTFANNASYGLNVSGAAGVTLTNSTFTTNADYALAAEPNTRLLGMSGLTLSNNAGGTKDVLLYRGGTISGNETWLPGVPWVVSGWVYVNDGSSLTVRAGTRVEMGYHAAFWVWGTFIADGTSADPIVFTSNQSVGSPGYWGAIYLDNASPLCRLSYALLSYGGWNWRGQFVIQNGSPVVEHSAFTRSQTFGVHAAGSGSPVISNSSFSDNSWGAIENWNPATTTVSAKLNFWNAATGPGGVGGGSGQAVTAGVNFEPWLLAEPSTAQFFSTANLDNRSFNPLLGIPSTMTATMPLAGTWRVTYRDAGSATVRTLNGSGNSMSAVWDGRNDAAQPQPDGTYSYEMESTGPLEEIATMARGFVIIDSSKQLTISSLTLPIAYFSPNGDAVQEVATLSATFSFGSVSSTLEIRNSGGTLVRTVTGYGGSFSYPWDGRDDSGTPQADGSYTFTLAATAGTASVGATGATTLDVTLPLAQITAPTSGQLLSNVYQNGSSTVPFVGTATDVNLSNWWIDLNISPNNTVTLCSGTAAVANAQFCTWASTQFGNGQYLLAVHALDRAGNSQTYPIPVSVGNFSMSQNTLQLNGAAGGTVIYASSVPFPVTQTIQVKNSAGAIVRNYPPVERNAGSFTDSWNGRDDTGDLLPDGLYRYVATVTTGASSMDWDLSQVFPFWWSGVVDGLAVSPWDPFNNQPLTVQIPVGAEATQISIALAPWTSAGGNCDPPQFCPILDQFVPAGTYTFRWSGLDPTGVYRTDMVGIGVLLHKFTWPANGVLLFGSKPTLTNVTVTPAVYGPANGPQQVEFDLTAYQNQPAEITVTFTNLSSSSVLRTVSIPSQAPGHATIPWDGRADNGMWVAPGSYAITVTARDALSQVASGQILTTVQY